MTSGGAGLGEYCDCCFGRSWRHPHTFFSLLPAPAAHPPTRPRRLCLASLARQGRGSLCLPSRRGAFNAAPQQSCALERRFSRLAGFEDHAAPLSSTATIAVCVLLLISPNKLACALRTLCGEEWTTLSHSGALSLHSRGLGRPASRLAKLYSRRASFEAPLHDLPRQSRAVDRGSRGPAPIKGRESRRSKVEGGSNLTANPDSA